MSAEAADFIVISEHPIGSVRRSRRNDQNGFFANQAFGRGDLSSAPRAASVVALPNYLTVQIGENRHIRLDPEYLKNINHSCDPNVFFDTAAMEVVALQDIAAGQEDGVRVRWRASLLEKASGDANRRGDQQELQKLEHSPSSMGNRGESESRSELYRSRARQRLLSVD